MEQFFKNSKIYLSGGGDENQSFSLDKFFFSTMPENGCFLYLPTALRGHPLYLTAHAWMASIVRLHKRKDVRFEILDDLSICAIEHLKIFDGIYIGGGNTWNLIQEFKKTGFSNVLTQYLETGKGVYGGSAGAIIMGKRIRH